MKILQVCSKPPYPAIDGGCKAMLAISRGLLNAGHELKLLTIATQKHPFELDKFPKEFIEKTQIEYVEIDTSLKPLDAFLNLFSFSSYNIERFRSRDFEDKLAEILKAENYDCVILEGLFVCTNIETIRKNSAASVILRAHNIEYRIWQGLAENESNFVKKAYLNLLARRLKAFELDVFTIVDGIAAISAEDKEWIPTKNQIPIQVVQVGIEESIESKPIFNGNCMFIGSMEWMPNQEAMTWFLNEVWPKVKIANPASIFYLAGKAMPENLLQRKEDGLVNLGQIEKDEYFWNQAGLLIAPLWSGGGLKVKIVEAMMRGKAVITTSIGAEGISAEKGKALLICNSKDEFIIALTSLLNETEMQLEIGKRAKLFAASQFGLQSITKVLVEFIEKVVNTK